jgi:hypothetical protein
MVHTRLPAVSEAELMRRFAIAAFCVLSEVSGAHADPDLDRIPSAVAPPEAASDSSLTANVYAQSDLTLGARRNNLVVPLPPPAPPSWEARLFLDARANWQIVNNLSFVYSGRLNLRAEDGLGFPNHENVRNDLRETYFAWQSGTGFFLELGRINLKSGVAEGFNPTDYFKTRAVVESLSADPTVLREDRLGTAMLLAQAIWSTGSLTFAVAPKLTNDSPPYLNADLPSFNPMFDRTNAHTRALIKASFHLFGDVSPEVLTYNEAGRTRFGLNVTKGFGQAVIGYVEWSGGRRSSLADDAFIDGVRNGVLSPAPPIPVSADRSFANDLAVGATYATRIGINLDLEYDYHQAGFSSANWRTWFDGEHNSDPVLPGALWFIRGYANDQQEPMARSSLFIRADWQNAFVHDLALTAFVDTDLRDGSSLVQFTADYYLSPQWTVGALSDVYLGRARSDFGSLPQTGSVLIKISRYF